MRAPISFPTPAPALHRMVWVAVSIGMAAPAALAAPGTAPPPKRKPAGAAAPAQPPPAAPNPPPRVAVPAIPEVAPDGPLSRSDLIQLAIQAHPDFWRFRAEVAFYLQAEAAAYDWKDPELRLGYAKEFEEDLEGPYEESRSINSTEAGFFDSTSSSRFTDNPDILDATPDRTSGSSFQSQQTSRNRQIQTETVRRITPGKYQDIIEETTYEVERRQENQKESSLTGRAKHDEKSSEYSRRRVLGRSREVRTHPNSVYGDYGYVVQVRFFIPHPWEMKARAARARAEADLASKRLSSEVRDLIFDVGRRYDELQFRYAWHQANRKLSDLQQENLKATEEEAARLTPLAAAGLANLFDPMDLPRARLEISKAREEVFDSRRELGLVMEDLCLLCGLGDQSRILLTNSLRLRKLSESQLDLPTLVELAHANRPELGEMHARADIERARLREVKALRLPWFNDLRAGWHRNIGDGYRDRDEFAALLTMNLPLWSWWQNKSHRPHQEAIASYEEAHRVLGQRIDQQVAFAIRAVQDAAAGLVELAEAEKGDRAAAEKIDAEAAAAADKAPRIRLAAKERLIASGRGRLQALYHYNQAVARLEQAIGLPIEEAFSSPPAAK